MPATAYRIRPGDTLSGIAAAQLGSAREWPRLLAFNATADVLSRGGARITDPDRIRAGDTIYLPRLGPSTSARLGLAPRPPARDPGPVALAPLVPATAVPFAMAYDIERHLLTQHHLTHTARVWVTCRFALARSDKVLLTHVMGKGYELTAATEARTAFGKLVSDTSVSFDPVTRRIGVTNGLTTQGTLVQVPRTAVGIEFPRPGGMPVFRAEITYAELSGRIGLHHYVATNVTFVVEVEPRTPTLVPVPVPVTSPRYVPVPAPAFDFNRIDTRAVVTGLAVGAAVVLTAGFAIWVFLPLAASMTTSVQLAGLAGLMLIGSAGMAQ